MLMSIRKSWPPIIYCSSEMTSTSHSALRKIAPNPVTNILWHDSESKESIFLLVVRQPRLKSNRERRETTCEKLYTNSKDYPDNHPQRRAGQKSGKILSWPYFKYLPTAFRQIFFKIIILSREEDSKILDCKIKQFFLQNIKIICAVHFSPLRNENQRFLSSEVFPAITITNAG